MCLRRGYRARTPEQEHRWPRGGRVTGNSVFPVTAGSGPLGPGGRAMARNLGLDAVVDHFTLVGDEVDQLRNKTGATRLGFALTLKFLLWRGRFPRGRHELPDDAVAHVARQVGVPVDELGGYDSASRTAQRHRSEIRRYTGFREC